MSCSQHLCGGTTVLLRQAASEVPARFASARAVLLLLDNDEAINDRDHERDGRMDCIDNASNTTSFLHVLRDLGLLPGWSVAKAEVRDSFSMQVHWTAVVFDGQGTEPWAVDSWFRPNGHLPFVMPLADWQGSQIPWENRFATLNTSPQYAAQLCGV